jgi:hypothetical protein
VNADSGCLPGDAAGPHRGLLVLVHGVRWESAALVKQPSRILLQRLPVNSPSDDAEGRGPRTMVAAALLVRRLGK